LLFDEATIYFAPDLPKSNRQAVVCDNGPEFRGEALKVADRPGGRRNYV